MCEGETVCSFFYNSFFNKKLGSSHTILIGGSNISILDNQFIVKDTAGSGYRHNINRILHFVAPDVNVIIGNNSFSDSTAANNCEFPASNTCNRARTYTD